MPTENRSSNTEMVIVPREPCGEMLNAARNAPIPLVHLDSMSARQDLEFSARYKAAVARFPQPDPQPHPEPIAWMVGTAFWWTKEEAERDAAAMGLPIVDLGPMSAIAPAEQHQGQPVGYRWEQLGGNGWYYGEKLPTIIIGSWQELYTNADPGEVERLREEIETLKAAAMGIRDAWREDQAKLAERDAQRRDKSGDLIRMAAHLISAPLVALQDLQDEDKKMTRARVGHAVDVADAKLKDAAYELRRIADALSASAEPSAPECATCDGDKLVVIGFNSDAGENIEGPCPDCAPSAPVERDERAVTNAFHDWAFYKKGEAIGRMDGQQAALEGFIAGADWQARAALERYPS